MTKRLRLSVPTRDLATLGIEDFVWRPPPQPSSFRTDLAPGLEQMTGATRRNIEFVRIATLTYLADRTSPRPKHGWARSIDLEVPVWDPDPWNEASDDLARVLRFLTSDHWTLAFVKARTPRAQELTRAPVGPAVSLFSGGADSLAAALLLHNELGSAPVLVSHRDTAAVAHTQDQLKDELAKLWHSEPPSFAVTLGRRSKQLGSNAQFPKELSSRSRSMLFVSLGLAVASATGTPLLIPENGFASINPPMGGERRGALSTRTTHPWYLKELSTVLESVGAHAAIQNPFAQDTKGQMFRRVAELLGNEEASRLLSISRSCSRSADLRFAGVQGATHCGVCFGCLVRRAAFLGSGVTDQTVYAVADLRLSLGSLANGWYNARRASDLQAVRYAAANGPDIARVVQYLPRDADPLDAIDIATRGLQELAALVR